MEYVFFYTSFIQLEFMRNIGLPESVPLIKKERAEGRGGGVTFYVQFGKIVVRCGYGIPYIKFILQAQNIYIEADIRKLIVTEWDVLWHIKPTPYFQNLIEIVDIDIGINNWSDLAEGIGGKLFQG